MDSVWNTEFFKFHCEGICSSGSIAVHRSIHDADSPFHLITAHLVVKGYDRGDLLFPYRAMGTAYSLDIQTAQLLQCSLHRDSVLSYDAGIISHHFLTILLEGTLRTHNIFVNCTECSESIAGEKSILFFKPGNHCFRPMHHRSHIKTQGAASKTYRIALAHHKYSFFRDIVITFQHRNGLGICNDLKSRIFLKHI